MKRKILANGISVVYEPEPSDGEPIVDIVLVHGLHGHPYKSWTHNASSSPPPRPTTNARSSIVTDPKRRHAGLGKSVASLFKRNTPKMPSNLATSAATHSEAVTVSASATAAVFWPTDLLPDACPMARVLMFGYDSKITKYTSGVPNKNSLLAHSRNFLYALHRDRDLDRPLIFVAHSFGGIIVKDMLARSFASTESEFHNIIESTAAIVFLGTPHRGSPELAAFGEYARSLVSGLGMVTTPAILDALGLKTADLERAQESFSEIWHTYDFRVKTFQEGLGLTGINLGILGNKVVPDYSSCIGDYREHAETLQANHKEMCRFASWEDPNFQKVVGEIRYLYRSINRLKTHKIEQTGAIKYRQLVPGSNQFRANQTNNELQDLMTPDEKASLQSLWFPNIYSRMQSIGLPAEGTCSWLFKNKHYCHWFQDSDQEESRGLLLLKGKPGTGKSFLVREAVRRAIQQSEDEDSIWVVSVFFNAKGNDQEHSQGGAFRSLLYQLLPKCQPSLEELCRRWKDKVGNQTQIDEGGTQWTDDELRSFAENMFSSTLSKRTIVYIDALDECDTATMRSHAEFWRRMTASSRGSTRRLSVFISTRHYPSFTLGGCQEIVAETFNMEDIRTYVNQRFELGGFTSFGDQKKIRDYVVSASRGIFLWAKLAVDDTLRKFDNGQIIQAVRRFNIMPPGLETLIRQLLLSIAEEDRFLALQIFIWAILAVKPLRVHEWHHILAFSRRPAPASLAEWRKSEHYTANTEQLEKRLRNLSRGLLEISRSRHETRDLAMFDSASINAGAGSLISEEGETRLVQVIHESVREFFLKKDGFNILIPDPTISNARTDIIARGHLSIMATCLIYLMIRELDKLVNARNAVQNNISGKSSEAPRQLSRRHRQSHEMSSCKNSINSSANSDALLADRLIRPRRSLSSSIDDRDYETYISPFNSMRGTRGHYSADALNRCTNHSGVNIYEWLLEHETDGTHVTSRAPSPLSVSQTHLSQQTRILEDYPALLSYATQELFTHAICICRENGNTAIPQLLDLLDNPTWERWRTLKEDIPASYTLAQYLSELRISVSGRSDDLDIDQNTKEFSPERISVSERSDDLDIDQITKESSPERKGIASEDFHLYSQRGPRRQGSVASFGSASSHTGSNFRAAPLPLQDL